MRATVQLTTGEPVLVGLEFKHLHFTGEMILRQGANAPTAQAQTWAWLRRLDNSSGRIERCETIAEGSALCSTKDRFTKEAGRQIALTRMLKGAPLTGESKRKIADLYRFRAQGGEAAF